MSHGFGPTAPTFRVASLSASMDAYVTVPGFTVNRHYPGAWTWTRVERG